MAAPTLVASPNSVQLTWQNVLAGSLAVTTLRWDTGSSAAGRVYQLAAGGETLVAGVPANGAPTGSVLIKVATDQNLVFVLRRADSSGTELARTTVTTRWPTLESWYDLSTRQGIYDLDVQARVDEIRVRFRTRLPSKPWVNLIRPDTGASVQFHLGKAAVDRHDVTFRGPAGELDQETDFTIDVVADHTRRVGDRFNDRVTAQARTGSRDVRVHFDKVHIRNDSDDYGSGELQFEFGAGEVAAQADGGAPGDPVNLGRGSASSGDEFTVRAYVTIPRCRRWVWAQTFAFDDDTDWGGTYFTAGNITFRPAGSTGRSDDDYDVTRVTEWFDTDTVPSRFEQGPEGLIPIYGERPFMLWSGDFALAFHVWGRLLVLRRPGTASVHGRVRMGRVRSLIQRHRSDRITIGRTRTASDLIATVTQDPQGTVLISARPSPEAGDTVRTLPPLAGASAVTATAVSPHQVYVFALDGQGQVMAADGDPLDDDVEFGWRPLEGRSFSGSLAVGAAGEVAAVFAIADDGSVHGWDSGSASWTALGGDVRSLVTLSSPQHGISLFAVDRAGGLLHKRRSPAGEWQPADQEWQRLGAVPQGALNAQWDGPADADAVVLNVIGSDEDVHLCTWPDYPHGEPEAWHHLGTVPDLLRGQITIR